MQACLHHQQGWLTPALQNVTTDQSHDINTHACSASPLNTCIAFWTAWSAHAVVSIMPLSSPWWEENTSQDNTAYLDSVSLRNEFRDATLQLSTSGLQHTIIWLIVAQMSLLGRLCKLASRHAQTQAHNQCCCICLNVIVMPSSNVMSACLTHHAQHWSFTYRKCPAMHTVYFSSITVLQQCAAMTCGDIIGLRLWNVADTV